LGRKPKGKHKICRILKRKDDMCKEKERRKKERKNNIFFSEVDLPPMKLGSFLSQRQI
jgi:hypothetical protein